MRKLIRTVLLGLIAAIGIAALLDGAVAPQDSKFADKPGITALLARIPTQAVAELPTFVAVHHAPDGMKTRASIMRFEGTNAIANSGVTVPTGTYPVRQMVEDPQNGERFAVTTHRFGFVEASGEFVELDIPESLEELSWPDGLAFNSVSRLVILTGRNVAYSWSPDDDYWRQLDGFADLDTINLLFDPATETFLATAREYTSNNIKRIMRVDSAGVRLGEIVLDPPIPFDDQGLAAPQLLLANDMLLLFIPAQRPENRDKGAKNIPAHLFSISPDSGAVRRLVAAKDVAAS